MKKMLFVILLFLVCRSQAVKSSLDAMPADFVEAMTIFKSNLTNNENFAEIFDTMTHGIREEFSRMIDDIWSIFFKMQTYCIKHIKENPLFEKYKQFMQKKSIKSTVGCSIENIETIKHEFRKDSTECVLEKELQPFYETLTEHEQIEFSELIGQLCHFFDELRLECELMFDEYTSVEEAFAKALEGSNRTLRIECGLEYPFPTLSYYID